MINLVPRYHWEYRLSDAIRGAAAAALSPGPVETTIPLEGIGDCFAVVSGRAALVLALRALDLPAGSRVAVPLYCCPVVFEAIVAAGHRPAFVDVEESTYCMSPTDLASKVAAVSAVVGVHMFGNLCDFDALRAVSDGRPLIEDCAQAIGTQTRGRGAGTLGDVSFFSFRCGKYVSAGEGGAVYSGRGEYRERLAGLVAELPADSTTSELVHVGSTFTKARLYNRPAYGLIGYPLGRWLDRRLNLTAKSGVSLRRIRKSDLCIARKRMNEIASQVRRQRANADFYTKHLTVDVRVLCAPAEGVLFNRYQYPLRCASEAERDRMAADLLADGVDTARYLDDVADVARAEFDYAGDCPISERLAKTTLVIPSSYNLGPRTVRRIAEAVNASWQRTVNSSPPGR